MISFRRKEGLTVTLRIACKGGVLHFSVFTTITNITVSNFVLTAVTLGKV